MAKKAEQRAEGVRPRLRTPSLVKEPSVQQHSSPEPTVKVKPVRAVDQYAGVRLLNKILEEEGGRDIIVMMRDSELAPQELAEDIMLNETIVSDILNRHSGGKDSIKRLVFAIEQAPSYLDSQRPVITGVRKQKRQDREGAVQKKHAENNERALARNNRSPRVREAVVPTLDEVLPKLGDQQIVVNELKVYLDRNASLRDKVMKAQTDLKATELLVINVGKRFDDRVKGLLAAPSEYQDLLAQAGASIRGEVRKYDAPDTPSTEPKPEIPPEVVARHQSSAQKWEEFKKADDAAKKNGPRIDTDAPEVEEKQEIFNKQEEMLRKFRERESLLEQHS